jgi:hypothetical protein
VPPPDRLSRIVLVLAVVSAIVTGLVAALR